MIRPDRALLADLSRFNEALGLAVLEMIHRQDGGELPAEGWRRLASQFRSMADVLEARADMRERTVSEVPADG